MLLKLAKFLLVIASINPIAVHAQSVNRHQNQADTRPEEIVSLQVAPIKTKSDLLRHLSNGSQSNPFNKLSDFAKSHLIDTIVVNEEGEIASFYIDDIRSELSPTDAYKVFSLFGLPELAGRINNGHVNTPLDAEIKKLGKSGSASPDGPGTVDGYYCNGGYCTSHNAFVCVARRCVPK